MRQQWKKAVLISAIVFSVILSLILMRLPQLEDSEKQSVSFVIKPNDTNFKSSQQSESSLVVSKKSAWEQIDLGDMKGIPLSILGTHPRIKFVSQLQNLRETTVLVAIEDKIYQLGIDGGVIVSVRKIEYPSTSESK